MDALGLTSTGDDWVGAIDGAADGAAACSIEGGDTTWAGTDGTPARGAPSGPGDDIGVAWCVTVGAAVAGDIAGAAI